MAAAAAAVAAQAGARRQISCGVGGIPQIRIKTVRADRLLTFQFHLFQRIQPADVRVDAPQILPHQPRQPATSTTRCSASAPAAKASAPAKKSTHKKEAKPAKAKKAKKSTKKAAPKKT